MGVERRVNLNATPNNLTSKQALTSAVSIKSKQNMPQYDFKVVQHFEDEQNLDADMMKKPPKSTSNNNSQNTYKQDFLGKFMIV